MSCKLLCICNLVKIILFIGFVAVHLQTVFLLFIYVIVVIRGWLVRRHVNGMRKLKKLHAENSKSKQKRSRRISEMKVLSVAHLSACNNFVLLFFPPLLNSVYGYYIHRNNKRTLASILVPSLLHLFGYFLLFIKRCFSFKSFLPMKVAGSFELLDSHHAKVFQCLKSNSKLDLIFLILRSFPCTLSGKKNVS